MSNITADEVQAYIAEAHRLRAKVFKAMFASLFRFLKQPFAGRSELRAATHA